MSDDQTPDSPPPAPAPVRLVKTSPEENAIRRDLLRHALEEASFAKHITENFNRSDFHGKGDIFDALKRSVQETGGVDRTLIGNAVGWDPFYEFERRLPEIVRTGDQWDVARAEMRKQIRMALHDAVRDQDDARAIALVERLREPARATAPAEGIPGTVDEKLIEEFILEMERNSKKELLGLKTSLKKLDIETSGFIPGELWAISAATSGGKTQIVSQMVDKALEQGAYVMYISTEMPAKRIIARILAARMRLNPRNIVEGKTGIATAFIKENLRFLAGLELVVRDDILELSQIEAAVREFHKRKGRCDLVVIDFAQNIAIRGVSSMLDRMLIIPPRLQLLARETKSCFLALSQMSNEAVREKGKGPTINHYYGAQLSHSSDVAIELVKENDNDVTIQFRKNRSGSLGPFRVRWNKSYSRLDQI